MAADPGTGLRRQPPVDPGQPRHQDVRDVLASIWLRKPETAARLRGRIEKVLDWATAQKFCAPGPNPAAWRGHLEHLLPRQPSKRKRVEHHAALAYAGLPQFMAELRTQESTGARALEFIILTAARSGEVLGARWSEIDKHRSRAHAQIPHHAHCSRRRLGHV
jgi:integrase